MKELRKILFIFLVIFITAPRVCAYDLFSDDMEHPNQAALDAVWEPGVYNGLTLTTEQNHTAAGSKSAKSIAVQDVASHALGAITNVRVTYWMYDSNETSWGGVWACSSWISEPAGNFEFSVFPWGGGGSTYYTYKVANDWTRASTGIARTQGWHKIEFTFTPSGGSIYFDDQLVVNSANMTGTKVLFLGNPWQTGTSPLYFDDVTVSVEALMEPPTPRVDEPGEYGLWHLDEVNNVSGLYLTYDDDSNNPGRDNDMILKEGTSNAGAGQGPQLESSIDSNMGNCMYFDGINDWLEGNTPGPYVGIDPANFAAEAWFKVADANLYGIPGLSHYYYTMVAQHGMFYLWLVDLGTDWRLAFDVLEPAYTFFWGVNVPLSEEEIEGWHHVRGEFLEGHAALYLDGVLIATHDTNDLAEPFTEAGSPPWIEPIKIGFRSGNYGDGANTYWYGWLDDVKVEPAEFREATCGSWGYYLGDLNGDCYVDMDDMNNFVSRWLDVGVDDFEYSSQAAMDAQWSPWGSKSVTLSDEQNHTLGGSKSARSRYEGDCSYYFLDANTITNVTVQGWFYDSNEAHTNTHGALIASTVFADQPVGTFEFGIHGISNDQYHYGVHHARAASGIARSTGWHKVEFNFAPGGGSIYCDDTLVVNNANMTATKVLMIGNPFPGQGPIYFDDIGYDITNKYMGPGDFDRSGKVNFADFAVVAEDWLRCTDPNNADCNDLL